MTGSCPPLELLAQLDRLGDDDPNHNHVRGCPRCRANLAAYRSFLDPPELGSEALLDDANQVLSGFLRNAIGDPSPPSLPGADAAAPRWTDTIRRVLSGLGAHPARALAPLGALLGILFVVFHLQGNETEILLRDGESTTGFTASIQAGGSEGFVVSWPPQAEPLDYAVVLYDLDFSTRGRVSAGTDSSVSVRWAEILRPGESDPELFWRVVGSRNGDEIVRSPLRPAPRR